MGHGCHDCGCPNDCVCPGSFGALYDAMERRPSRWAECAATLLEKQEVPMEKLVRRKIAERILNEPENADRVRKATEDEIVSFLERKVREELCELFSAYTFEQRKKEAGDLLEVVKSLCAVLGISFHDIEGARLDTLEKEGGFHDRYVLRTPGASMEDGPIETCPRCKEPHR